MIDKPYDSGSKRLLGICAQNLLNWIANGALFSGRFSEEFQSLKIDADSMIEASWHGKQSVVLVEFQSNPDSDMAQRLAEYSIIAFRRYQCPIVAYVIYLKKGKGKLPQPPLIRLHPNDVDELHRFQYKSICLWKIPYKELMDMGLYPLAPLDKGGAKREVIEEIISHLTHTDGILRKELLELTSLFASLAFKNLKDQEWLQRRFAMLEDFLSETPMHKFYMQRALEKAQEIAPKLVKEEGIIEGLHQALLTVFQARFPKLSKIAQKKLAQIEDPALLRTLLEKVASAQTIEDALDLLLELEDLDQLEEKH